MRRVLLALVLLSCMAPASAEVTRVSLADAVRLTLDSKILGEQRTVVVHLPRSYATGASSYPVLYMTDGDGHLYHTAATAEFLARNGRMPEVIIVGILNTDRTRDLTPTHVEDLRFDGQPVRTSSSGGADKFLSFVATELIPLIESRYRTQPYRVFAGHSFGGLFALHALFTRPELFQAWIAVSPTLGWDDGLIVRRAGEFFETHRDARGTLVFSLGDEGAGADEAFDLFKRVLSRRAPKGFEWLALRYPEDDHGSTVLPTHLAALKKIFAPWRFVIGRNDDPRVLPGRVRDHYAQLSRRVGYDVPVPEGTRNLIAYRLLQASHTDEAIEVFKANVAAYPVSANVYDSLGEAYERKGELALAKENYARAAEIGARIEDPNAAVYKANLQRVSGK